MRKVGRDNDAAIVLRPRDEREGLGFDDPTTMLPKEVGIVIRRDIECIFQIWKMRRKRDDGEEGCKNLVFAMQLV